jgi:perosamine synthetase
MEFFVSEISPRGIELAHEVLASGWVSEGPLVREFEAALEGRLGLRNPVAVNSGTSALHLGLAVVGVGPGDEVILPPQTFVATGLAVLMQHATPVFADIDPHTGNICPESIRGKITRRTRAVIPVHWAGYPCELDEINHLAEERGLAVIEDAAHALGGVYRQRPVGSISRLTCFSFQAIKHLTTGDGGVLCCLDGEDHHQARCRRWFGIDRENAEPSLLGERVFDIDQVGYKYHMNDLAAAVGLGNLEEFPGRLARRREIAARYRQQLADLPGLELLRCDGDREHAWWLFSVLADRREDFIRTMKDRGVPVSVVHQRIDRFRIFGGCRRDLPGQADFDARHVALPIHPLLTDEQCDAVISAVQGGW